MAPASPDGLHVIILGGGISGLTTALAITKFAPAGKVPKIEIFEIRPEPATIGGAVNLTPNALRLLDHLGVLPIIREKEYGMTINAIEIFDIYSGKLAESSFRGPNGDGIGNPPYKALRITRGDALKGVLGAVYAQENITLTCGKRTVKIDETPEAVTIHFEDGGSASGDLLMGCDGIHSVTRLKHVEPERKAVYSGVSNAFGFTPLTKDMPAPHFECTGINFARRGMLLTSFHHASKSSIYVGALMQVPEVGSRDGWRAAGADQDKVRADIKERFGDCVIPCVNPIIDGAKDFYLWPVFTLSKSGKWSTNRTMLLGDAAHAMPPQGESTGIVFEDTVLFSRCVSKWMQQGGDVHGKEGLQEAFERYEALRRARIETAFEESKDVVKVVSDAGWLGHKIKTLIVPWYLWWSKGNRDKHFVEDVTTSELGF